jgi:hypothetical protein
MGTTKNYDGYHKELRWVPQMLYPAKQMAVNYKNSDFVVWIFFSDFNEAK